MKFCCVKVSQNFPKPYEPFSGDINVTVDLSNYAVKADLKNATGIDASKLAAKSDLVSLKAEVGKLVNSRYYTETNITFWQKLRFEQNTSYSINTVKCPNIHPACSIHLEVEFCLKFVWQAVIGQKNFVYI